MTTHNPPKVSCLVSVIIPMYNAKDYIGECLNSLLRQTFQDFEVIVVDDCSTDNSVEIVKDYMPKFGERLLLSKTETNSGGGGYVPRNIGLNLSNGDYIFFVDADDFLAKNALDTLYDAARGFNADVVYTGAYYDLKQPDDFSVLSDGEGKSLLEEGLEDKQSLTVDDPAKNLKRLLPEGNFRTPWARFVRRDFLTDNVIFFPEITTGGDFIWTIQVHCHAKTFLRIPTPVYFHRNYNTDSVSRTKRSPQEQVSYWFSAFIAWTNAFQDLVNKTEILRNNPEYSYQALRGHFGYCFGRIAEEKWKLDRRAIYELLYREFAREKNSSDFISSFLFSSIVFYRKSLAQAQWNLGKLKKGLNPANKDDNAEINALPYSTAFRPITCAVSVIIPLYNAEKYIRECLNSLLAQTFQNFEVIVVDDNSADNSVEVVERCAPKFGGRLILEKMDTNYGNSGIPRNKGLELAGGEYVFFLDADDALTKTALEEMYTLAKKHDADTVYCEKYFTSTGHGRTFKNRTRLAEGKMQQPPFVNKPTIETENLTERIIKAIAKNYLPTSWLFMTQRKLLIDKAMWFESLAKLNNVSWAFEVLFNSKRFLRIPNACYIKRIHNESEADTQNITPEIVSKCMLKTIGNCLGKNEALVSSIFANLNEQKTSLESSSAELATANERIAKLEKEIERLKNGEPEPIPDTDTPQEQAKDTVPVVSVIIPMYNAEDYIGECLDSLLIQTLQNFEVIVVDDCSIDNSVEIVESYQSAFNGRLKLKTSETNSCGGGYVPRNVGLSLASGEYIFFLDSDDFILNTALETLYNWAKENEADVVYMGAYYDVKQPNDVYVLRDGEYINKFKAKRWDEPTLTVDNPKKNLNKLLTPSRQMNFRNLWTKFVRREFLLENNIVFPEIFIGGDFIWVINVYCRAKKFLRFPLPLYFYRHYNSDSVAWKKREGKASQVVSAFVDFMEALNEVTTKNEVMSDNPDYSCEVSRIYLNLCISRLSAESDDLRPDDLYEILYRDFSEQDDEFSAVLPFFFSNIIRRERNARMLQDNFAKLTDEIKQLKDKE